MFPTRQSVSFLRRKFQMAGIYPKARRGQNFLIDLNLLDLLVRAADVQPHDVVLEVGTGTGSLTSRLAQRAAAVVTVEIDPQLAELAQEQLAGAANVTLLQQDVLRNKNQLEPNVLQTVRDRMAALPEADFKLVANLPYAVATPLIANLLASDLPPSSMTVTIQRELADRILAAPRSKDYGSLSAWVQVQCRVELVREMGPSAFWPRPQVHSSIIRLELDRERRAMIEDLDGLHRFLRNVFLHRRKLLRGALAGVVKALDKGAIDQLISELELPGEVRAEELTPAQLQKLAHRVARAVANAAAK
jgi:16S rRNA (adenine1518-N6/adenine1519-N6)-dimethyltransferase